MDFFLILTIVALLVSPTFSTSRHSLTHSSIPKTGFQVTLKHVDSNLNFSKSDLMQRAMKRGKKRMERLHELYDGASNVNFTTHIHAVGGEFEMYLSIGTPPMPYSAILDTGSDLIWTQCKPCNPCIGQDTPIFDPTHSSSFSKLPCSSDLCKALPIPSCNNGSCEYSYEYGDYSTTQGIMGLETFTFENVSVPKLVFGCGLDNEGEFLGTAGIVGLGRGPLSLISQLNEPKFAYCLPSFGSIKNSTLWVGSLGSVNTTSIKFTTPLVSQTSFYVVSLKGITVGKTLLPIKNSRSALNKARGTPNMIVDSGTTVTLLDQNVFDQVKEEFTNQIKLPVVNDDDDDYVPTDILCFNLTSDGVKFDVPKLTFNFDGADLELPVENYFVTDSDNEVGCLAMESSGFNGLSIFGNFQQQNMLVVYDLVKETLSFEPTQCDKL